MCCISLKHQIIAQKLNNNGVPSQLTTVGDHLLKTRIKQKLTLKEASELMEINYRTIRAWELNHNEPRPQHMPSIVKFLGYIPFNIDGVRFSQKLKIARYCAGHSMESLGQYLGLSKDTIEHNEHETLTSKQSTRTILKQFVNEQFLLFSTYKQLNT